MAKNPAYSGSSDRKHQPEGSHENQAPKIVAYCRVSTADQDARDTQEAQRNAINRYCLSNGVVLDEWLEEQESTLNPDRPEFQRLMDGLRSGEVGTVIVSAIDRFSRDQIETLQAMELMKKLGASFHSLAESIHIVNGKSDQNTDLAISLMSMIAKNERETIRIRTMSGKARKVKKGQWVTGQAPFGYELDRQTKILKLNEAEAALVNQIFNLRLNGVGTLRIVKQLNATLDEKYEKRYQFKGVRYCQVNHKMRNSSYCKVRHYHNEFQGCPECVTKHGGIEITGTSWSPTLIKKALKNRVYLGEIKDGADWITAAHLPIIDRMIFDRVQEILKEEYQRPYRSYPNNILSGLVQCSCGSKMYQTHGGRLYAVDKQGEKHQRKQYWAFTCPRRKVGKCNQKNVSVDTLYRVVSHLVWDFLSSEDASLIIQEAYDKISSSQDKIKPDLDAIRKNVNRISKRLRDLSYAYTQAARRGLEDNLPDLLDDIGDLKEQKEHLEARIKFLEAHYAALTRDMTESLDPDRMRLEASFIWGHLLESNRVKHTELAGKILRAFVTRIDIKDEQIKPVLTFDHDLIKGPMDELLLAVLKVVQLRPPDKDFNYREVDFLEENASEKDISFS